MGRRRYWKIRGICGSRGSHGSRGSITIEAMLSVGLFLICSYILTMIALVIDLEEKVEQSLFETGMGFHQMLNVGEDTINDGIRYIRLKASFEKQLNEKQINEAFLIKKISLRVEPDETANWFWIKAQASFELPLYGEIQVNACYHVVNAGDVLSATNLPVYLTETGKRYHMANCMTIKNSKNLRKVTEYEAWEKGYSACNVCVGTMHSKK